MDGSLPRRTDKPLGGLHNLPHLLRTPRPVLHNWDKVTADISQRMLKLGKSHFTTCRKPLNQNRTFLFAFILEKRQGLYRAIKKDTFSGRSGGRTEVRGFGAIREGPLPFQPIREAGATTR